MTQDRRITDKLPEEPLVFTDAALITAGLAHLEAEKAGACLVHAKDDVWVGVGTKGALRGLLSEDTTSQSQAVPSELASLKQLAARIKEANCRPIEVSTLAAPAILKLIEQVESLSHSAATGKVPEDEQVAFEAWYFPKFGPQVRLGDSDQYFASWAQGAWQAWSARAALASPAAPLAGKAEELPNGWKLVAVNPEFDKLIYWMDRADGNGNLPSDVAESYASFEFSTPTAPLAAAVPEDANLVDLARLFGSAAASGEQVTLPASACAKLFDSMTQVAAVPAEEASAEPSRASRIEWSLRQIIEADDDQALTQDLIEAGRAALKLAPAEPAPIQASALTDEDAKAISRAAECVDSYGRDDLAEKLRSLLARLSKPTAQGTASDELPISVSTYGSIEECEKERARRAGQSPAPVAADAAVTAPSIDTPEFREVCRVVWGGKYDALAPRLTPLIAHINRHIAAQAPAGRDAQPFPLIIDIGYRKTLRRQDRKFGPPSWDLYDEDGKLVRVLNTYEENFVDSALKAMGGKSHAAEQASGGAK